MFRTVFNRFHQLSSIVLVTMLSMPFGVARQSPTTRMDFSRDVLPILSNKCFICHGPDSRDPDQLRLDSAEAATGDRGGYRAVDSQHPEKSAVLARIHSADDPMPPVDAEKQLTNAERDILTKWIQQGGDYAMHWAFVPPEKHVPANTAGQSGAEVIDAFIAQQLAERGIAFAPEADRGTLARRAALTLTGLPPEPDLLASFLADESDGAYERLVDSLLADLSFGEHQARYWLDAVRYGDTHGLHLDNKRGIYPYRDWVVRAFNQNLPLSEFIRWQIAGDLGPDPSLEQLVATGFVRLNPSTGEGGAIPAEFQCKNNFDRVETLGTVFLGMSLTCARCHTHKYDPIPQTEYYRLLAYFNSTAEPAMDSNKYDYGPTVKVPKDQAAWDEWIALEKEKYRLVNKGHDLVQKLIQEQDISGASSKKWLDSDVSAQLKMLIAPDGDLSGLGLSDAAADLVGRIEAAEAAFTTSLIAKDLDTPRPTHLLQRGEYDQPAGDPLQPGVISVMGTVPKDAPANRIGLAAWLTSRQHPLVARVLVNRLWQRTFGDALVRTPEDFGLQGQQATHPELLDWLAVELHDSHWDLKHMLRMMVTSQTFRQNSAWRSDVEDPENRLFARGPRYRLDAEVLRDIALWSSELLDPHIGGEGVKPYQPAGMWLALAHPGSNTKKYERDSGKLLYRRSLYVYWKRTSPHPMMTLFDAPDRESSCVRRSRTNTSLQSLGLLNETQRIETGRKLAERLLHEAQTDEERLNLLFTLLASRLPTDDERSACTGLLAFMRTRYAAAPDDAAALLSTGEAAGDESLDAAAHAAWTQVAVTVLASDVAILMY